MSLKKVNEKELKKSTLLLHCWFRLSRPETTLKHFPSDLCKLIYIYTRYVYSSVWSTTHKGPKLVISNNGLTLTSNYVNHSARLEDPLPDFIESKFTFVHLNHSENRTYYFFGVISSAVESNQFEGDYPRAIYNNNGLYKYCYGIDDEENGMYFGNGFEYISIYKYNSKKPEILNGDKMTFICDFTNPKLKKLILFINDKIFKLKDKNYTILLPNNEKHKFWYPCVSLINRNAICTVSFD